MFVRDRMTMEPVTIAPDTPFLEAVRLLGANKFRRLPVVDKQGRLVGIVSERDLLRAAPAESNSLEVWEVHYQFSKLKVRDVMIRPVITTTSETPIEEAARVMVEQKIGGLPVVEGEEIVGIITKTDIFRAFAEMLGVGAPGLRLTLEVPEQQGVLAELAQTIAGLGGTIVSVGTFRGDTPLVRKLVIKVRVPGVSQHQLVAAVEALGDHVVDARSNG